MEIHFLKEEINNFSFIQHDLNKKQIKIMKKRQSWQFLIVNFKMKEVKYNFE